MASQSSPTGFTWGVNAHGSYSLSTAAQQLELDAAQTIGLTSLRVDVYDASPATMAWLSPLITQASSMGISILPVIVPATAALTSQSAAYAWGLATGSALAAAFPGLTWEVGNELDLYAIKPGATGQSPSDYDNARYSAVLGAITGMSAGIRQADPTAKIAVNMTGWDFGFLQRLASDGVSWDITSEHVYVPPGVSATDILAGGDSLFASLAQFGKPILMTEFNQQQGSLLGQSAEINSLMSMMDAMRILAPKYDIIGAYIYELLNEPQLAPAEANYGLADSSGVLNAAGLAVENYLKASPVVTIGLVSDTGSSSTDLITSNSTIAGTTNPLAIVHVTLDGSASAQAATADANGAWTFNPTGLADGQHTIAASETSSDGTTATSSLTFTLDTKAPIPLVTNMVQSGGLATLTGSTGGSAGETLLIYDGTIGVGTATTGNGGSFSVTVSASLLSTHVYSATATDIAGNVGKTVGNAYLGSTGSDTIVGSAAADLIQGGGGADILTGGGGKDTFVYTATSDSTPSAADTITDFVHGTDKIDFTNIAGLNATNGVPQFQGGTSVTSYVNLNAHSFGFIQSGGNTIVLVNTSNTAETVSAADTHAANMKIVLVGINLGLTATDFHHA